MIRNPRQPGTEAIAAPMAFLFVMHRRRHPRLSENRTMSGIQFVTDEKGRKVGVLIDLKKHGAIWEDFWDGLISESRRKEKGIPYEQYRASRLKRTRPRG
jgi:hypothetical protein